SLLEREKHNERKPAFGCLGTGVCRRRGRHALHPDGRRQHVLVSLDGRQSEGPADPRSPRALLRCDGRRLCPRYRQGRGRLGDVRAGLYADHAALAMAARGNAPVVVFAGDAPIGASWYIQSIDQAPLALAAGAHFVRIRTMDRALDCVREGFYVARAERKPVVLSVPLDLQTEEFPYLPDYMPSTDLMPRAQVLRPDPAVVAETVSMIAEA